VFWALGLPNLAAPIMAVPMLVILLGKRPLRLPRGFLLWALFLLWSAGAVVVLGVNPPNTVPGSSAERLVGFGVRELSYFSVTIVMLYIGNLSESEFSQKRLVRLLGVFFIWTVAGGVFGMLAPHFQFTSPFELILPDKYRYNLYVQHLVHPTSAQVQDLLGNQTPRPAAPFGYTNTWAYHVTVLGIWFVTGWVLRRRAGAKVFALAVLATGAVTLIYSLNRAAWLGCIIAGLYFVVRLAMHRRLLPLAVVLVGVAIGTLVLFSTPLHSVIGARLSDGKSNGVRAFTTERALQLSVDSPVIGYGSTRAAQGSSTSIAVGKSVDCQQCGNISIGINGYFFMLLMSTGWVGAFLFISFGVVQVWRVRGDPSPIVAAGIAVILLTGFYGVAYDISSWMLVPLVTLGILWRESQRRAAATR
jgi:O-antigen ligase